MNCGVSASTVSGGIPSDAANARSSSSIEKSGGIRVPRAILLLSFFSLTSSVTSLLEAPSLLLSILATSGGFRWIPVECPVEFADMRFRLFRSLSHARRLSIVEVSTGRTFSCPVETALAAIASSSVATALTINSTGIPLPCMSAIMFAIGVFKPASPRRACKAQGLPGPPRASLGPAF
jgi:hypothetical protein